MSVLEQIHRMAPPGPSPGDYSSCSFCGAAPADAPPGTPQDAHPHWRPAPDPTSGALTQDPELTLLTNAGPITWRLFYDSANAGTFTEYGYGRRASWPLHLDDDGTTVSVSADDGTARQYLLSGGVYTVVCAKNGDSLVNTGVSWEETRGDTGLKFVFPLGSHVLVTSRATPQGQSLTTRYINNRLRAIIDTFSRRVTLQYNTPFNGQVIYVQNWAAWRWTLTYDKAGYGWASAEMTSFTGPTGCITRYGYDPGGNHLLTYIQDPEGFETTYTYDFANRVLTRSVAGNMGR